MDSSRDEPANDIEALKAALAAAHDKLVVGESRADRAEAELAAARAQASDDQALIAYLKLQIENSTVTVLARARNAPRGCWTSSN